MIGKAKMNKALLARFFGCCLLALTLIVSGCITTDTPPPPTTHSNGPSQSDYLQVGDRLRIGFSGLNLTDSPLPSAPMDVQITDSGNVSLPLVGGIKAAGKTIGQLEVDIRDAYVPKLYRNLNVSVTTERFYFVGGEVKNPSRQLYLGGVTVLRAIQTAGDFTDFADRKHVLLVRANGEKHEVNCKKALNDRNLDLPVFPGDTITVPRGL
jgi:polysaccharide export outer membrane protein